MSVNIRNAKVISHWWCQDNVTSFFWQNRCKLLITILKYFISFWSRWRWITIIASIFRWNSEEWHPFAKKFKTTKISTWTFWKRYILISSQSLKFLQQMFFYFLESIRAVKLLVFELFSCFLSYFILICSFEPICLRI